MSKDTKVNDALILGALAVGFGALFGMAKQPLPPPPPPTGVDKVTFSVSVQAGYIVILYVTNTTTKTLSLVGWASPYNNLGQSMGPRQGALGTLPPNGVNSTGFDFHTDSLPPGTYRVDCFIVTTSGIPVSDIQSVSITIPQPPGLIIPTQQIVIQPLRITPIQITPIQPTIQPGITPISLGGIFGSQIQTQPISPAAAPTGNPELTGTLGASTSQQIASASAVLVAQVQVSQLPPPSPPPPSKFTTFGTGQPGGIQ